MRTGDADDDARLRVLGELVVDMLPVPSAGAGPEGTAPRSGVTINCTRVGADPPTRAEHDAARAAR